MHANSLVPFVALAPIGQISLLCVCTCICRLDPLKLPGRSLLRWAPLLLFVRWAPLLLAAAGFILGVVLAFVPSVVPDQGPLLVPDLALLQENVGELAPLWVFAWIVPYDHEWGRWTRTRKVARVGMLVISLGLLTAGLGWEFLPPASSLRWQLAVTVCRLSSGLAFLDAQVTMNSLDRPGRRLPLSLVWKKCWPVGLNLSLQFAVIAFAWWPGPCAYLPYGSAVPVSLAFACCDWFRQLFHNRSNRPSRTDDSTWGSSRQRAPCNGQEDQPGELGMDVRPASTGGGKGSSPAAACVPRVSQGSSTPASGDEYTDARGYLYEESQPAAMVEETVGSPAK